MDDDVRSPTASGANSRPSARQQRGELWRVLVLQSGRSTTDHWLTVRLFRRHHADGTPGALTTALLLCTDGRWDRCTARLIAGIADASLLSEDDLDELAARFLWSDRFRFQYPVSWIGTEWVSIDVTAGEGAVSRPVVHLEPTTPVPTERFIPPPLRRWSARRVLRADPSSFDAIRDRAAELGTRDGGAVVSGMLDAVEVLSHEVARQAIDLGLGWPQGSVRLLALDLLAAVNLEGAGRRVAADPDAKVRNWTPRRASKREASDVVAAADGDKGDANRVDLSCGRLDIWSGRLCSGRLRGQAPRATAGRRRRGGESIPRSTPNDTGPAVR